MKVRIAGIIKESIVDGPGVRYVIFAQGCRHKCPGCHNPETHDFNGGYIVDADEIINDIRNNNYISGVTFSGGDPLFQIDEFKYIAEKLKYSSIHIMCYTGFKYEDIIKDKKLKVILDKIDLLVDGPFIMSKKTLKLPYRGSSNQRIIDVKKSLSQGKIILADF